MIAVVVLTHDRVHLLRQCVEKVLGRDVRAHDRDRDLEQRLDRRDAPSTSTRSTDPRLRVVHHPENIGQNAYAEAFKLTTAPYLLELDDDMIEAPAEWDRSLLEAFERLPQIGFLAANLVDNPHDQAARVMYEERPHLYHDRDRRTASRCCAALSAEAARSRRASSTSASAASASSATRCSGSRTRPTSTTSRSSASRRRTSKDVELTARRRLATTHRRARPSTRTGSATGSARSARTRVKRRSCRLPFVRSLNERYGWFRISDAPEL